MIGVIENKELFMANKAYGYETLLNITPAYVIKIIEINPNASIVETHINKWITYYVMIGNGSFKMDNKNKDIKNGDIINATPEIEYKINAGNIGMTLLMVGSAESLWE